MGSLVSGYPGCSGACGSARLIQLTLLLNVSSKTGGWNWVVLSTSTCSGTLKIQGERGGKTDFMFLKFSNSARRKNAAVSVRGCAIAVPEFLKGGSGSGPCGTH